MAAPLFSRLKRILTGDTDADADAPLFEAGVSKLERFVHFCVLVGKSFVRNRCPVRASALSYATLLALIPMLAVAMGVTSVLLKTEGTDQIERFVERLVASVVPPASVETEPDWDVVWDEPEQSFDPRITPLPLKTNLVGTNFFAASDLTIAPPVPATNAASAVTSESVRLVAAQKQVAQHIHTFIQNTQSGTLGTLGMVLLILVAIRMLANIEETFNDIWGVTRGRGWLSQMKNFCTLIVVGPLLLAGAGALLGGPHFQATKVLLNTMPVIGSLIFQLLPLLVLWLAFALFYQLVPNTKVHFSAAAVGGAVAGSLWFLNNYFGFLYVSRVVSNSKIYGSLGLVPVFMAGLFFSWIFLLLGAQVAYAFQNRAAYFEDRLAENVNQRGREFIALRLLTELGQRFEQGLPPATMQQLATGLGIPSRLAQQVLRPLLTARLVTEVAGRDPAYAPARPLDAINAHQILQAMRSAGGQELITRDEPARAEVFGEFARIEAAEKAAAAAVTLRALVHRAHARLELAAAVPAAALAVPAAFDESESSDVTSAPAPVVAARPNPTATTGPDDKLDFPL